MTPWLPQPPTENFGEAFNQYYSEVRSNSENFPEYAELQRLITRTNLPHTYQRAFNMALRSLMERDWQEHARWVDAEVAPVNFTDPEPEPEPEPVEGGAELTPLPDEDVQ
jgi:hypothetical protein